MGPASIDGCPLWEEKYCHPTLPSPLSMAKPKSLNLSLCQNLQDSASFIVSLVESGYKENESVYYILEINVLLFYVLNNKYTIKGRLGVASCQ